MLESGFAMSGAEIIAYHERVLERQEDHLALCVIKKDNVLTVHESFEQKENQIEQDMYLGVMMMVMWWYTHEQRCVEAAALKDCNRRRVIIRRYGVLTRVLHH